MAISSFFIAFVVVHTLFEVGASQHLSASNFNDKDKIQVALNLEFLEAEFFTWGALGQGLDSIDPCLAQGGPPPIGAQKANLKPPLKDIIKEFGFEEVGHLRAIIGTVGGFPRPQLDLSPDNFEKIFDKAVGYPLNPPFNPYANSINYLLASYAIPYVGLVGYVGTIPILERKESRSLVASLLGVESGQDAVIRALLYESKYVKVPPYNITVGKLTQYISKLRNDLGGSGIKDEGIVVDPKFGAEGKSAANILSADKKSLSYGRTPREIFRIVYGSGNESTPGGFFPKGGNGKIAQSFLTASI